MGVCSLNETKLFQSGYSIETKAASRSHACFSGITCVVYIGVFVLCVLFLIPHCKWVCVWVIFFANPLNATSLCLGCFGTISTFQLFLNINNCLLRSFFLRPSGIIDCLCVSVFLAKCSNPFSLQLSVYLFLVIFLWHLLCGY